MQKLSNMVAGVRYLADNIWDVVRECINNEYATIVDMNAEQQLYERGENRLGVTIMDYMPYSEITVEFKKMKGQPYDRVTLRDEGDFEESFYVEAGPESFTIRASDMKTAALTRKYGDEILGLSDENLQELITHYVLPAMQAAARKYTLENGKSA